MTKHRIYLFKLLLSLVGIVLFHTIFSTIRIKKKFEDNSLLEVEIIVKGIRIPESPDLSIISDLITATTKSADPAKPISIEAALLQKHHGKHIPYEPYEPHPMQHCNPTTQIVLDDSTVPWKITALDRHGRKKHKGGDEYYITYTDYNHHHHHRRHHQLPKNDNNDNHSFIDAKEHPTAIAMINDLDDGTYTLEFVSSPSRPNWNETISSSSSSFIGGILKIYLDYTCGMGQLAPSAKDEWNTGASLNRLFVHENSTVPPNIRIFQPPSPPFFAVSLSSFDKVLVFGDSIMAQFVGNVHDGQYDNMTDFYHDSFVYIKNVMRPLHTFTIDDILNEIRRQLEPIISANNNVNNDNKNNSKIALLLGSSTWDILTKTVRINDHIRCCRKLIHLLKGRYPNVTIIWKLPFAMHIHRVSQSELLLLSSSDDVIIDRVRYMSESRTKQFYKLQKQIMVEEYQIPVIDLYEVTYLSAEWTKNNDGRHFEPQFNQRLIQWYL